MSREGGEIAPGVHRITTGAGSGPGHYAPNSYLVVGGDGAAFIDTGWARPEDVQARLDYLAHLGNPIVKAIAVTHRHPDHVGGALAIQRATGAQVVTAPAEQGPIEKAHPGLRVRAAADGEVMGLGGLTLEFVHAPGHTLGSLVVFLRERKALFTGDNVMGVGTSVIDPREGDLAAYLETLEKLLRYGPAMIYPGHGPQVDDAQAKLRELIAHRMERETQVLTLVREHPRGVEELVGEIYPELDVGVLPLARDQVRSHLLKLMKEGRVAKGQDEKYLAR
ncbi:MAG: MBL fold metallo-hydrolase [Chloroflexi bacterium]|nr:MBL fold metallo-hydrolase [Chloroflexota bacterium]